MTAATSEARPAPYSSPAELERRVSELDWYHSLELLPGLVTPGWLDTRRVASRIPFPDSIDRMRCLDVGTFDGFWAFEMERRGAAEVVAVDLIDPCDWDWPAGVENRTIEAIGRRKAGGAGFELARFALGSSVNRLELSVYDLDPERVGVFDLVYVGSLLLHLRDPIGALMRVRRVCTETLVLVEAVEGGLGGRRRPAASLDGVGRPWWWTPNVAALVRMAEAAGFEPRTRPIKLRIPAGAGQAKPRPTARSLIESRLRANLLGAWIGSPHAALRAGISQSSL